MLRAMAGMLKLIWRAVVGLFRSKASLEAENLTLRLGVTAHPTAEWIAQQLTEPYGWEPAPKYLIRDRDSSYGEPFRRRLRAMGIRDRPTAPRSPWQNGHVERLIGSIRRECLDHVIVFS
jgi:transposase InsO family protein